MRVSGDRDREVDLLRNLEKSQRFLAPRLSNETAQLADANRVALPVQGMGPGGAVGAVEFEILSGYNPPPSAAKDAAKKDEGGDGQAKPGVTISKKPVGAKMTPIQSGPQNGSASAGGGR
jgi:type IV pilus assembly protein PilN